MVVFVASLFVFSRLGGEFIPQLEEGDLAAGVMTLQGGSLSNTIEKVEQANKILLKNFPEIRHAVCKIGAGEIPTDPTPMETGDYIITLKPKSEWTSARSREELIEKMEEALIPLAGVKFEFQQPIQMRFNELMSGSKQDVAVKIYGDNLNTLADKAAEVEKVIQKVSGVEDINVEKVTGLAQIQIEYNRNRLAQYGLSVSDVNKVLNAAFAGSQAGVVYDEEKRFGLVVRFDKDFRQNPDDIKNLSVALPNGGLIPLDQLASVEIKSGPAQVSRENTKRKISVGFNVRGRDIQTVIEEVSRQIDAQVKFPTGYYVNYGGQFKNLEAAKNRLAIAVPVALLLIFVLLFFTFHSVKQTLIIYTAVPMSIIGGILALWVRGMNFSISAGVGFIALFGIAVLNGIVLIAEFNRLEKEGITDIYQRVTMGLNSRLRPVIMTAAVASLGFLPMALSTSAGAEVQKPLATVVIGGLITATLLTLFVLPVFYIIFSSMSFRALFRNNSTKTLVVMIVFVLGASVSNVLNAQNQRFIQLKEAIQMALDSNLSVRSAACSVEVQKALKGTAWDLPKTSFEAEYGQINSFSKDNNISISQSFSFPSVYVHQQKLATANVKSSEWQLQATRLETATQVKQIYCQLSYLYSKKRLYSSLDSLYTVFRRGAELSAKTGETNHLKLITARSESMEMKNNLQQVSSDLLILNRKLKTLLNMDEQPLIADTILHRVEYLQTKDDVTLSENPLMAYIHQQVEVSEIEKKLEISRLLPEFNFGYFNQSMLGVQEVNGSPRVFTSGDRLTGISAGISVPLWITPGASKVKAAKLKQKAAQTDAENYSKSLAGNYGSLMLELNKNRNTIDYYEKQAVPEADLIITQATLSFKSGQIDYSEYLISLNRAISIKINYLDAVNNFNQTVISIDYITGKIF